MKNHNSQHLENLPAKGHLHFQNAGPESYSKYTKVPAPDSLTLREMSGFFTPVSLATRARELPCFISSR